MKKAVFMMGSIEFLMGVAFLWMQTVAKSILQGFKGSVVPILVIVRVV